MVTYQLSTLLSVDFVVNNTMESRHFVNLDVRDLDLS